MSTVAPFPNIGIDLSRPGQQLLPAYVVKLLKTLKIPHGTDRSMSGIDTDPTVNLIKHIVDCMGALRDVNKIYRGKGSLASRSIGARAMFGFTAELGNLLLDAITFNPPAEYSESVIHYSNVAGHILNVFPEIAAQVTKDTGKMLIHHVTLKASPIMALDSLKMVLNAYPTGSSAQDISGALPLHWITHNSSATFDMVTLLISANPSATLVADMDGYLPIHWAVNQDQPNIEVVAALLAANVLTASKPCNKGSLPLHWCVNRENPSVSVVEALLQAHPDAVRTFNDDGWLPIHRCVDRSNINIEVLRMLIDVYPQGLECPNSDGQLPLHRALDHPSPDLEVIKLMIEAYPGSCKVSDDEGYLPLHLSLDCASPSVAVVKYLLSAYPAAAQRKSRDGLLPLHCVCSSISPPLEIVQCLLDSFPESPEHAAVDVVPMDEDADPDTWQGEWVKKRWTPLSRSIGRKLNSVVAMMKASLLKKRVGLGTPLAVVEGGTSKGVFMPLGGEDKHADSEDESYRRPAASNHKAEDKSRDKQSHGRDRDRDRDKSRHRHHSKDRDDKRRHRNRDDKRRDSDSDRSRDYPGRGRSSERDDHQNGDDGDNQSPSHARGSAPSIAPPRELLLSAGHVNSKRHSGGGGDSVGHVVVPLKDLEFSDDEDEIRMVGRSRLPRNPRQISGEDMV